uniref:ORF1 n=1 Tax=Tomato marchitez virus TaxID=470166 RepID=A0A140G941_9SECO|nr:ORF1 [Tomato marchitez virus]AMM63581.1 ORF1 [Tomato marchitez virus]
MSFIGHLNTSVEEQAFHQQVASSNWICSVDVGTGLINSNPTLDFKVIPPTGGAVSVLTVSWENSTPQIVPGHYLLRSGNWPVKNVKLSGLLVHRSVRLETTRKVLEENKVSISNITTSSSPTGDSKGKSKVDQPTREDLLKENKALREELERTRKELLEQKSENQKLRLQLSNQVSNNDIFSGWTENGPQ